MTETTHQENHASAIKTPGQLVVVVLISFVVTITLLVLLARYAATSLSSDQGRAAMSEEEVAQRLKPVGEVALAESGGAKGPRTAEDIVKTVCAACHASGALGAPKIGDKAAWAPRLARGLDKLTESALRGVRAMPPKGGAADLSDAEVAMAVIHLASQSGAALQEPATPPAVAKPETRAAAPETPPAAKTAAADDKGKSVFNTTCSACHATGAAGAPKLGDKAAWAPRLAAGKSSLYTSALKGKAVMPPKGGNASLSDEDVKAAVDYLVSQAK